MVYSGVIVILSSVTISGSLLAATGKIKLVINGQEVATDVAPKVENGRVLVPISTVSKALGVPVQWDAKNNSVKVDSKPNIWQILSYW